jgi:RND family efflux transporter MFP subunit
VRKVVVLTVAVVTLIAVAGAIVANRRPGDTTASLEVIRVARRTLATDVKATGVVRPMTGAQVRVGPRISGIVRRLSVRVGDQVTRGQRLAELDDRELLARRREAAAALDVARANRAFALSDARRKHSLAAAQLLATSDLEVAERAAAVAEQEVARAQAVLDYAETQLAYARVDAPIAGTVASVATQEGETVAASFETPTFVTLLDLNRLEVWAYVDETDIGRIRLGQHVSFTVDTYGAQTFDGEVSEIHPQPEIRDNVVDYVTVVRFQPRLGFSLRPEMTTAVRITTQEARAVLAVPLKAIHRNGSQAFVWRRTSGRLSRVPVTLGLRNERDWEVAHGLAEGDEIVVGTPPSEKAS